MLTAHRSLLVLCGWLILFASRVSAADPATVPATRPAMFVGLDPAAAPGVSRILNELGYAPQSAKDFPTDGDSLVVLQLDRDLPDAAAHRLGEHVRRGGSLLLVIPNQASFAPMRLTFMLPTTAWKSYHARGIDGPIEAGEFDSALFGDALPATKLSLPYHTDLRPFHAVERGQARYERFAHNVQGDEYIKQPQKPGDTFWTRSLINRDWTFRIRGDNQAADGLLVTGRYGAGRVAVFGAGIEQLENWAGKAPATVGAIAKWLSESSLRPEIEQPLVKVSHAIDKASRKIVVTVSNPSPVAVQAEIIARVLSWEGTLVCDVVKPIQLAAGESKVEFDLPVISASSYQAQSVSDSWNVRLGLLVNGGADLVGESRFSIDLRGDPLISVSLDDLYGGKYPYDSPHPETMPHFQARLGSGTTRYAYKPGETINVTVRAANGVRNIAPQARVKDLVQPSNASIGALTDGSSKGEQSPTMTMVAFGTWSGADKRENAIEFDWPESRTISGVTLVGAADDYRKYLRKNPGAAVIEIDGKEVARADDLDKRFPAEMGRVRLAFPPSRGSKLAVRVPWTPSLPRSAPVLAEVEIAGTAAGEESRQSIDSQVMVKLIDAETNTAAESIRLPLKVGSAEVSSVAVTLRAPDVPGPHAYRIEATVDGKTVATPLLVTDPKRPLRDVAELNPAGGLSFGFIVTRGFRNFFKVGTGTQEMPDPWKSPDDLIWTYSRLLKQEGAKAASKANRLYVTSNDFKHYSSPWRMFANGESVMQLGAAGLAAEAKAKPGFAEAKTVRYEFSDRWDTGPSIDLLHSWQDYTEFDQHLRKTTGKGLEGQTRAELAKEIHGKYEAEWMAYQKSAYVKALQDLAAPFEAAGKKVFVSAQGVPLVSGSDADYVYRTVRGMSDDSTWGMAGENVPLTTGRQMGTLAFNPSAAMSNLFMWGWDSAILNNPFWRVPIGTTEASRRHQYDRAWRGTIAWDGTYQSIHTYGYNANGGTSYQMLPNDWQELWRAQERLALIPPEVPIGVGLVISTTKLSDPKSTSFNGAGGDSHSAANGVLDLVPNVVRRLQEAGMSVPFAANASALRDWKGDSPLVLLNVYEFSDEEIAGLKAIQKRGVRVIAIVGPNNQTKLTTSAKSLIEHATIFPADVSQFSAAQANDLYESLLKSGEMPIVFPAGTGGYGFVSGGAKFIVLEDWREFGRSLELRLKASPNALQATAVGMNEHVGLPIRRDGGDWVIALQTRPGDGTLVMIREVTP